MLVWNNKNEVRRSVPSHIAKDAVRRHLIVYKFGQSLYFFAKTTHLPQRTHSTAEDCRGNSGQLLMNVLVFLQSQRNSFAFLEDVFSLFVKQKQLHILNLRPFLFIYLPLSQNPLSGHRGGDGLIICKFISSNVGQQIRSFLAAQLLLDKTLIIATPVDDLFLAASETQGGFSGRQLYHTVVKFYPVRSIRVWRSVHKREIMPAVVGLSPVHCHSKQNVIFFQTCGSALEEAQIDACGVFKICENFNQPIAILAVSVALKIEKDNLGQFCNYPVLAHFHLAVIVGLYQVLHVFLHQKKIQGLAQSLQSVIVVVLQKQINFIEFFRNRASVWFLWVP